MNKYKKSRILTNTSLLYFRTIISAVITLFSTRLIIKGLGLEDYGIYSILFGVSILFGAIQHALTISTQKFITEATVETNNYEKNSLFSVCLFIHLALAILVLLIALPINDWVVNDFLSIPINKIQRAIVVYNISIYIIVTTIIFLPFQSIFFAYERLNTYGVLGIVESLGKLALAFSLIQFNDRLTSFAFGLFLISVFINLSYFLLALYRFDLKLTLDISNKMVKKVLIQFYWNFVGTISNVINNQGQNILLNVFFGPILNTSRAISVQVKNTTYLLGSNIQSAINAPIVKLIKANKIHDANKLIFLSSKIIFFLILFIATPIILFTTPILNLWLGEYPDYTILFIRLILLELLFHSLSVAVESGINAKGKLKKYQSYSSIFLISSILVSYIILQKFNKPEIVYFANIFFTVIVVFTKIIITSKYLQFSISDYTKFVLLPITKILISVIPIFILISIYGVDSYFSLKNLFFLFMTLIYLLISTISLGLNIVEKRFVFNFFTKQINEK